MQKFKVIENPRRIKPDYPGIYAKVLIKSLEKKPDHVTKDWICKHVYLTVKGLPIMWNDLDESALNEDLTRAYFDLAVSTKDLIAKLTPRELTQIFPVTKEYDGLKYGWKDYYTTMKALNKIGMDHAIGDSVDSLLWDYENRHVRNFLVFKMSVLDALRRLQGQSSMMEEFMAEQGITPMRMMTGENNSWRTLSILWKRFCPLSKNKVL